MVPITMIPLSSTIALSTEILSQEVDGETIFLDLRSESYFGLDKVGTRIWQLLQQDGNLQRVFNTMLEEYDVGAEQLEKDMNKLLDKLIDAELITVSGTE